MLDLSPRPFKCIISDVLYFIYDLNGWWINDCLFSLFLYKRTIFVRVIYWHFLLETFRSISFFRIQLPKINIRNVFESTNNPCNGVSLFNVRCWRRDKPIFILPLRDQSSMNIMSLLEHVGWTVCLLKLVGFLKLLQSILCLVYIRVTANVRYYV